MVSTTSSNAKERDNVLNQAKTAFRAVAGNLTNKILKAEDLRTAICITGRNPSLEQCKIAWNNAEAGEEVDFSA